MAGLGEPAAAGLGPGGFEGLAIDRPLPFPANEAHAGLDGVRELLAALGVAAAAEASLTRAAGVVHVRGGRSVRGVRGGGGEVALLDPR